MTAIVPLSAILATIPTLDPAALDKIHQRIKLLKAGDIKPMVSPNTVVELDYLLVGAGRVLNDLKLWKGKRLPPQMIPRRFVERSPQVRNRLERKVGELPPVERIALGVLAMGALSELLQGRGVPISARTLLSNIDKIEEAIECYYPGYLRTGRLRSCWSN